MALTMVRPMYLERLRNLRLGGAPKWIIKSSQVNMVLARQGLRGVYIGRTPSKKAAELFDRHVRPFMGVDND